MENASKALIMAASVLIGVVIMSLAVYLFTYFSSSVNEMNNQIEQGQLQQFNNQFTSYEAKGKTLTIYDVITVTNLAKENNAYYGLTEQTDNNFYIKVVFQGTSMESKTEKDLTDILLTNSSELDYMEDEITGAEIRQLKKYQCEVHFNANTGRVNKIVIDVQENI